MVAVVWVLGLVLAQVVSGPVCRCPLLGSILLPRRRLGRVRWLHPRVWLRGMSGIAQSLFLAIGPGGLGPRSPPFLLRGISGEDPELIQWWFRDYLPIKAYNLCPRGSGPGFASLF